MSHQSESLAALIGSRICHDLISPIGAVNNGLELLALSGAPDGPEMSLVADSAASANARIRLLRLAFGIASRDQSTRSDEITSAWQGTHSEGRVTLDWRAKSSVPREMARALLLACLCLEVALPQGGKIDISETEAGWRLEATGSRIVADEALWANIAGLPKPDPLQPAHVQFLLLPVHLAELGRRGTYQASEDALTLTF